MKMAAGVFSLVHQIAQAAVDVTYELITTDLRSQSSAGSSSHQKQFVTQTIS